MWKRKMRSLSLPFSDCGLTQAEFYEIFEFLLYWGLGCNLSFRAGIYGTKTGLFSWKRNLLFSPVYSRKLKRHITALFSLVRKKVPKKYAIGHALWTPLRRKTETPLRSACFTAILEISQFHQTQESVFCFYASAT